MYFTPTITAYAEPFIFYKRQFDITWRGHLSALVNLGSMGSEMADNPGHYHKHLGSLYSVEPDGSINKRLSNVSISNGMAWSMDNKVFYYIDTYKFAVEAYDFDITTGDLSECLATQIVFNIIYVHRNINTRAWFMLFVFTKRHRLLLTCSQRESDFRFGSQ